MQIKLADKPKVAYKELSQSSKINFSMGHIEDDTVIEWFYPVKCRDFLCDVVYTSLTSIPISIYEFTTDPSWPVQEAVLILTSTDSKQLDNIVSNSDWVDSCFKNKIPFEYERVNENTLVLLNAQQFYTAPWAISLLTCVLRYSGYQVNPPDFIKGYTFCTPEFDYIRAVNLNQFKKLLDNTLKLLDLKPTPEYTVSGFLSDPKFGLDNKVFIHNFSGFKGMLSYSNNFYKEALDAM